MSTKSRDDIVTEEGYTLAPFLLRLSAASIDAVFFIAGIFLVFFLSFACPWYPTLDEAFSIAKRTDLLQTYQRDSGLMVIDENGVASTVQSDDYNDYLKAMKDFYFVFNAKGSSTCPAPAEYTVMDFNTRVLDLPKSVEIRNDSKLFDFALDTEGEPDPTSLGVIKPSLFVDGKLNQQTKDDLLIHCRAKYLETQDLLLEAPYYASEQNQLSFGMQIVLAVSIYTPFLVFYLIIPLSNREARTLGKRFMHLMVIDVAGKPLPKYMTSVRALPFILTAFIALLLDSVVYSLSAAVLVFMITLGCATFTKKRRALHDYVSHSIVAREEAYFLMDHTEKTGDTHA